MFALGFVPVKAENTVVLLSRDTPQNGAGIKDLNLDLTTWEPLISKHSQRLVVTGLHNRIFGKVAFYALTNR